jgi:hypothetical protein
MEENAVVIMVSSGVRLSEVRSISSVLVEVEEWSSTTDDDDRDRVDAAAVVLLTGGGDQAEAPPRPLPW